ncbi:adenylate kinase 8 isoform X2 [Tachysurus fulvidraco]|uniref:adenylate kinase 8 isoform X2 n=1 Tax=Tachysurus fulvidraco TaxID=1234273 RepID=UPI001FEFB28C|nr:adenylate kinase 8 isoform X2 [Tachysurus fulvidraco]
MSFITKYVYLGLRSGLGCDYYYILNLSSAWIHKKKNNVVFSGGNKKMDATDKPLRIPMEMSMYAEKHEIFDLIQTLVRNLLIDKPEDPIQYLIGLLKRESIEVPRILILGPPASGKTTVAKKLCEHIGAIHITSSSILKDDTELRRETKQYTEESQEIPQALWIKLIVERLSKADCVRRGWVLEAIPKSRQEALCLQASGIAPEHVVMLQARDDVLTERNLGKRIDPVTGDVYHVTFMWPESAEVAQRLERPDKDTEMTRQLQAYHRELQGLQDAYSNSLKIIDADQPHVDVFGQVLSYVLSRHRSDAPHTPRILLFGPPGCGKSLQASLLAQKYNLVDICCGELLKAVAADESSMGELIKPFLESGRRVPDSMVLQILTERLSRVDCITHGWVLHGFPRDVEQAERLQESNFLQSRYHSLHNPAPGPKVQARLQNNPRDCESEVCKRLEEYRSHAAALQAFYPQAVQVNADQQPHTVFECLENGMVGRPSKVLPELNIQALSGSSGL